MKHKNKRLRKIACRVRPGYQRPSSNADNFRWCLKCNKNKYCYPTAKKAELALRYNNVGCTRYYYCKRCCAYHLTSETKEEYWDNLEPIFRQRFGKSPGRGEKDLREEEHEYTNK